MVTSLCIFPQKVRLTNNCKENEVFTNCGSACDLTCENITAAPAPRKTNNYEPYVVLDEPAPCRPQYNCIPGCYCRKPLYRNRFGDCVEEKECRRNFNRNDFVEELNKFLGSFTFDEKGSAGRQPATGDEKTSEPQSNQKYIAVNDNSESVINPRTGYHSSQTNGYPSAAIQSYRNLFNFNERDFFGGLFDDIFSQDRPKQPNYRTNYNYENYNTANTGNTGSINVGQHNELDRELEKQIEKEADIIIQQISNGLK